MRTLKEHRRKIGERGQVTIPKDIRQRKGFEDGDEVVILETDEGVLITPPVNWGKLAEGYNDRRERSVKLMQEMEAATAEADALLGDAPEWEHSDSEFRSDDLPDDAPEWGSDE